MMPERQVPEPEHTPAAPAPSPPRRTREALVAIAAAAGLGAVLQPFVPRGSAWAAAVGVGSTAVFLAIALVLPARVRRSLVQQEGFAALLAAIAVASAAGSVVPQRQREAFYSGTYGDLAARLLLAARLDDAFHSPWFSSLAGLFCAAVVLSALQRWPPSAKNLGFHLAHAGLVVALSGAASSAAFAVRGRVELQVGGEDGRFVHPEPPAAGPPVPLGFALRLDRFDVERYGSELRIGYYETAGDGWRLRASFEPEQGVRHRLPRGGGFVLRALSAGPPATASVAVTGADGSERDEILAADGGSAARTGAGVLVLERRPEEVRTFRSEVSAIDPGGGERSALVEVNSPFHHGGWTFYQASWDPRDPRTSGFQAVRDPGAFWVLLGFAVIAAGVIHALYVHPRLRAARE